MSESDFLFYLLAFILLGFPAIILFIQEYILK